VCIAVRVAIEKSVYDEPVCIQTILYYSFGTIMLSDLDKLEHIFALTAGFRLQVMRMDLMIVETEIKEDSWVKVP
jgi:hypothetical protein